MENIIRKDKAEKFISPNKLDVIVKLMYIRKYIEEINNNGGELYKKLILKRTGGIQKNKDSLEEYFNDFNKLIKSFRKYGYKKEFPIPVSSSGDKNIILDGSHRLACSYYFDTDVYYYYTNNLSKSWDYKWFLKNSFSSQEIEDIIREFTYIKDDNLVFFIIWPAAYEYWDSIESDISKELKILFSKDYYLDKDIFKEILLDVYAYEFGPDLPNKIYDKLLNFQKYGRDNCFRILIGYRSSKIQTEYVERFKNHIREKYNSKIPLELFITLHSSDDKIHFNYLRDYFLSKNNINWIKRRKTVEENKSYRKKFIEMLCEYKKTLKKYNIKQKNAAIIGGAVLEVLGIKECDDIDFILDSSSRNKLFTDESRSLTKNVDLAHKGYDLYDNKAGQTDDEIIFNNNQYFYFRGLKFANLNIVENRKKRQKRKKDVKDIKKIDFHKKSITKKNKLIKTTLYPSLKKSINMYKNLVEETSKITDRILHNFDEKEIKNILNKIYSARNILISSDDENFLIAQKITELFKAKGYGAKFINNDDFNNEKHKDNILILISNNNSERLLNLARNARDNRIVIISFLSKLSLELSNHSDYIFDGYNTKETEQTYDFFHSFIYLVFLGAIPVAKSTIDSLKG
ncbi:MAG: hypothetical protein ACOCRX_05395 [Candidatus Woesearchaeota archaeon]